MIIAKLRRSKFRPSFSLLKKQNTLAKPLFFGYRFLHQNYYHPYDVPAYQVPTLGDDNSKKPPPQELIYPYSRYDHRCETIDIRQGFKNKDSTIGTVQLPEMFLPEMPTFLEFWGTYPFLFFLAAFAISKQYFVLVGATQFSTIFIIPCLFIFYIAGDIFTKTTMTHFQKRIDSKYIQYAIMKYQLEDYSKKLEEVLKMKERSKKFNEYIAALTRKKVDYFAFKRRQKLVQNLLQLLQLISKSESYFDYKKKNKFQSAEKKIDYLRNCENKKFKDYDDKIIRSLEKYSEIQDKSGKKVDFFDDFSQCDDQNGQNGQNEEKSKLNKKTQNLEKNPQKVSKKTQILPKETQHLNFEKIKQIEKDLFVKIEDENDFYMKNSLKFEKEFLKKFLTALKSQDIEKILPIEKDVLSHLKKIDQILSELKIYNLKKTIPKEMSLKDLGIERQLTEQEIEKIQPKEQIRKNALQWVKEQIGRFKKGKVPQSLLNIKRKFE